MRKSENVPQPFVKWAGGKRQLLEYIRPLIPKKYNRYFEPFIGGGALYFDLRPPVAHLNDINEQLIVTYRWIKKAPFEVMECLDKYDLMLRKLNDDEAKIYYYSVRDKYNKILEKDSADVAALLIWLNKHCFNGLYRCNSKGFFNVPYANTKRTSYDKDNILAVSKMLKSANLTHVDFERVCNDAKKGDFFFLDSPYAPVKADSFVDYTKEGFSREDHIRLAEQFKILTEKGCYCILTNHNTEFINSLYEGFSKKVIQVKRLINRNADSRKGEEVIISNY